MSNDDQDGEEKNFETDMFDDMDEPINDDSNRLPRCAVPILPNLPLESGDSDGDLFGDLDSSVRLNDISWNKLSRDNNGPDDFTVNSTSLFLSSSYGMFS